MLIELKSIRKISICDVRALQGLPAEVQSFFVTDGDGVCLIIAKILQEILPTFLVRYESIKCIGL